MPACDVVRVASGTGGRKRFWTVQPGGALKLDSEDEAQYFVCHGAQTDRSCVLQHLQSGAFIEQGENRGLKLALTPASATVFSKLRAYSEGSFRPSYSHKSAFSIYFAGSQAAPGPGTLLLSIFG